MILKLNFRGTIFQTTVSNLMKFDGCLERFVLNREIIVLKNEFAIWIDQDPKHFDVALNFLRDGDVPLPDSSEDVKEIREVAKFWCIQELAELCTENLDSQLIKLDVRGQTFHTSVGTSRKMPKFKDIESKEDVPVDESGIVSFDQNPKHFRLILNFLRDGYVALPESPEDIKEIQKEAEYYLLNRLVSLCKIENQRLGV